MSLDTLANVKARLGVTGSADDALLALLQDTADAWVANHCGRDFAGGSFTEYHPGATGFVFLRHYPVQSVTSLRVDAAHGFGSTTELAATAYVDHSPPPPPREAVLAVPRRDRGAGRPTKRDRRELERLFGGIRKR